ncbi:DUF2569 family protein [Novosphingobium huizhouense]|uniref:DUF2569 family protein n=1 Tax=Novosphingobium huizhouense TaxID=2866625 RepID=UPI001CD8489A
MSREVGLRSIRGWLAVLTGFVGVLIPLGQLGSFLALLKAEPILQPRFGQNWPTYFALTSAIIVARAVICLLVARALIWNRHTSTPKTAAIGIWVALFLLGLVSVAIAGALNPEPVHYNGAATNLFWIVLICVVATAYLLRSKRVAQTYGNF